VTQPVPFGKYYLLERINVGGMAEVFKAKAFGVEGFERLVAVKRILPNIAEDEEFITMFIDEAKIAVQLQHANIAQIFDLGKVDDSYFIALEFVHGKDLRAIFDHFRKVGDRMPAAQVCYVMMQVCEGLDYAHNKRDPQGHEIGLVHRDVSPQNVLVGYEGEIKLVDFGIAKAAGKASKTQAGILKGKFGYMSPEQVRGLPVDRRSDVFAAGICLYELLTGERLFVGESDFSTLEKVRNVEILPPSSFNRRIAPELERIVLKALAKDAEDRYQNAIDLHDELQAYLYSAGEFFSRKDLAGWMKQTFSSDIAEESARNAQWEQLEQPTPAPMVSERKSSGSSGAARGHGLDWDDEELETQIFDRMPGSANAEEERPSELSSSDIMLPDVVSIDNPNDDKTAIAPPPDEAQLAFDPYPGPSSGAPSGGGAPFGGYAQGALGGPLPAPGSQGQFGQTLLGGGSPLPPGPPPGLSAYRQTGQMPIPNSTAPWGQPMQPPQNNGGGSGYQQGSPFRQTIMGLPQMAPPYQPPPPPPPQPSYTEQQMGTAPQRRFPLGMTLAVLVVALGAMVLYTFYHRQGQLRIEVTPTGATVAVDGVTLKGLLPVTLDKAPGTYRVTAVQEGYAKEERRVEVEPGGSAKVRIDLRPSPDTGFELTSDPPGQLVWMDGVPFTGVDAAGPQARTDFKATRVPPGRHLLEIKGDPRFRPWRHEFYQEPGRLLPIRANLLPEMGVGRGAAGVRAPVEMPKPIAEPAVPATVPRPTANATPPSPPVSPPSSTAAPARATPPRPATTPGSGGAAAAAGTSSAASPSAAAASSSSSAPAVKPPAPSSSAAKPPAPAVVATPKPPAPAAAPTTASKPRPSSPRPIAEAGKPVASAGESAAGAGGGACAVTIGSKPWAEVWIDGKNTTKLTPLVDFKLPCGKHKITLKNPEMGAEKNETVTVRAGEKWKKIFQLLDDE
jgi:serine/threonine protein kinase